jgi:hypothetical protein
MAAYLYGGCSWAVCFEKRVTKFVVVGLREAERDEARLFRNWPP